MKQLKNLIVPAALLALAGLSGCNGHEPRSTGMPIIDRWMSPGSRIQPIPMRDHGRVMPRGPIEYAEPPETITPNPVPAPTPPGKPSALIRPHSSDALQLPSLTDDDDPRLEPLHDTFFESDSGHTPLYTN